MADEKQWHLDKKVPLGIIGAIVFQTITFVALGSQWMTKMEQRVGVIERSMDERKTQSDRLIVVEQNLNFIRETVADIARKLEGIDTRARDTDTRAREDRLKQGDTR